MNDNSTSLKTKFWVCITVFVLGIFAAEFSIWLVALAWPPSENTLSDRSMVPRAFMISFPFTCLFLTKPPKFTLITTVLIIGVLVPVVGLSINQVFKVFMSFETQETSLLATAVATFFFSWVGAATFFGIFYIVKRLGYDV